MADKKILLAFNSQTILSMIKDLLEENKYSTIETSDGIEALHLLFSEKPDIIIASTSLQNLSGYNLCRIIKNSKELNFIKVILSASEDSTLSFWSDSCKADNFYTPTASNDDYLIRTIEKLTEKDVVKTEKRTLSESELTKLISSSYDDELFELYLTRNAHACMSYIFDLTALLAKTTSDLSKIIQYDAISVIINETPLIEYDEKLSSVSNSDFEIFKNICHNDFQKRFIGRDYDWNSSIKTYNEISTNDDDIHKIKSYYVFPTIPVLYPPVSFHLGTISEQKISPDKTEQIDKFVKIYSDLIAKGLLFRKANIAEEKMHRLFSRFLPSKIIDSYIEDNEVEITSGEQRNVAILIADIRNFTTISEKTEPDKIVSFLNQYFSEMGKIIKQNGGTIDKFMGDAIMVLFGATDSFKNNGLRAANCAIQMSNAIPSIPTDKLNVEKGYQFKIGIGVNYGTPVVGTIGSEEKLELTVIGDDVNLASRIESLTKYYGVPVIVSETVKEDIYNSDSKSKYKLFTRHLDNVKVKGKSIAVKIYELYDKQDLYSQEFLSNYEKGLQQSVLGNFSGALEYLKAANKEVPEDKATILLMDRCVDFIKNKPKDWNGAISMTIKQEKINGRKETETKIIFY